MPGAMSNIENTCLQEKIKTKGKKELYLLLTSKLFEILTALFNLRCFNLKHDFSHISENKCYSHHDGAFSVHLCVLFCKGRQ